MSWMSKYVKMEDSRMLPVYTFLILKHQNKTVVVEAILLKFRFNSVILGRFPLLHNNIFQFPLLPN